MSEQKPVKRKRAYRYRVVCSVCQKEIVAEYQDVHAKTKHKGKKVKFTVAVDAKQAKLCFATAGETVAITTKRKKSDGDTDRVDNDAEGSENDCQTTLKCVNETVSSAENIEGRDAELTESSVSSITVAVSVHNNDVVPVRELSQNDPTYSFPSTGASHDDSQSFDDNFDTIRVHAPDLKDCNSEKSCLQMKGP
ncbi:Hypothetical predicted protein, partial [Paramuricea clavata]